MKLKVVYAKTWKEKILGLIGKKEIHPLYFETRFGIHTFGLRKPIDVIILDTGDSIVVCKQNLKPNRVFLWNPRYKRVLELPNGMIVREKLKKSGKVLVTELLIY